MQRNTRQRPALGTAVSLGLAASSLLIGIGAGCQETRKPTGVRATTPARTTTDGRTYLTPHDRKPPKR